jgi:PmbA protein
MNYKKFLSAAAEAGISPFQLIYASKKDLNIRFYQTEVETYISSSDSSLLGRGIYQGKTGSFTSDRADNAVVGMMMEAIKSSSPYGREGKPEFFVKPGLKYKRVHSYFKDGAEAKPEALIDLMKYISVEVKKKEPRIQIVQAELGKEVRESLLVNSNGLKLKSKASGISLFVSVVIKDGEETESSFEYVILDDLTGFDKDAFVAKVIKSAVSKLHGVNVPTGKYDVVYSPECIGALIKPLMDQLSAYQVHQHLSLFEGKLNQGVLSKKLTVFENPWAKGIDASSYDEEGMPTLKKALVNKGVISTYIYDLENAAQDKKESTGNGSLNDGNIVPALGLIQVKPSRLSLEALFAKVGNGIYITQVDGVGTGLNEQTGEYSLQASGFFIKDGKLGDPIPLMTVAGSLLEDFAKVKAVGSDDKLTFWGVETPSIAIKKLVVAGK